MTKHKVEFAFGMCQECYMSYIQASGGIVNGAADPPAFTRNLRKCALTLTCHVSDDTVHCQSPVRALLVWLVQMFVQPERCSFVGVAGRAALNHVLMTRSPNVPTLGTRALPLGLTRLNNA
jgi:hypothetical protein